MKGNMKGKYEGRKEEKDRERARINSARIFLKIRLTPLKRK